jgi:coenzyme F420-reducing hydrogenase gamma subunit
MRQMLSDLRAEIKAEALSFLGQGSVQQTDDEIALKMAQGKASLRKFALRQKSLWQTVFSFWDRWTGVEPTDASIDVDINVLDKPVTPQEVQVVLDAVATGTMDADTGSAKLNQLRWLPEGLKLSAIALPQSIPQTNKVMINKVDDSEDDNDDEVQS